MACPPAHVVNGTLSRITGAVKTEQGDLPIAIEQGEQENYLEFSFPALLIKRWPYAIHARDESGEGLRLFAGYIGVVESVASMEASTVYDIPVMGIAIPIDAGKAIKAQWRSNTAATLAAQQAEGTIKTAETNAGTSATNAAHFATAVQKALAAIPQVDEAGNMTLAGGLAVVADVFTTRLYLDASGSTATNSVVNQVMRISVPGGATTTMHVKLFAGRPGLFQLFRFLRFSLLV